MKRILPYLAILIFVSFSCTDDKPFNQKNRFYKGNDNGREKFLTFINDTIAAINSDSLKPCSWDFISLKNGNGELFQTDELKVDTIRFKPQDDDLVMTFRKENLTFISYDLPKLQSESVDRQIELAKGFYDKKIYFDCDFSFNEVSNFYQKAIEETKKHLKHPNSVKISEASIRRHKIFNEKDEYVVGPGTAVSLNVEAKNGFGNFVETTYYVFFFPKEDNSSDYKIEFSTSPIPTSEVEKMFKL